MAKDKLRCFVTGGSGFIGSHLVDRLLAEGNVVTVYDNLVSGKKKDIEHHIGENDFTFLEADLLDTATLKDAMKGHDIVWHLGANTDIPGGNAVTDLDLKNCTIGTYNVLEAMKELKINKLLFPSSATVYGEIPDVDFRESLGPLLPISLYGAGKLACEGLISAYSHLFNIQAWMFRFANVVGGRMGHGVIYDFIHKLVKNPREMEILGDGKQEKSYFLVEECIEGMFHIFRNEKALYSVHNLGSDTYSTVTGVADIICGVVGLKDVKYHYTGGARGWPGDVPIVHFDVSKVNKLGWRTRHTSDEALRIAAERILKETI